MLNDWRLKKGKVLPSKITSDENLTVEHIKEELANSDDLIIKEITIVGSKKISIVCIDGLVNSILLDESVIKPLIKMVDEAKQNRESSAGNVNMPSIYKKIEEGLVPHIAIKKVTLPHSEGKREHGRVCFK